MSTYSKNKSRQFCKYEKVFYLTQYQCKRLQYVDLEQSLILLVFHLSFGPNNKFWGFRPYTFIYLVMIPISKY